MANGQDGGGRNVAAGFMPEAGDDIALKETKPMSQDTISGN
jgi:hypothetical protein